MPIRVEYLRGAAAIDPEVDAAWRELHRVDPAGGFTSGPEFAAFVRRTFGVQGNPATLLLWADDQLQLLWPLSVHTVGWSRMPVRQLQHRNGWHTVYGNPLFAVTANTLDPAMIADAIRKFPNCDALRLARLRADPLLAAVGKPPSRFSVLPDRYLDLSIDHDLPGKFSRELFRCRNRLSEVGALRVAWLTGDDLANIGSTFAQLHTRLKSHQGQWQVFRDHPGSGDRLGPALAAAGADGRAGAIHLAVDGVTRGVLVFWNDRGSVLTWRSAWDPEWKAFGLGAQLLWEVRKWAAAHGAHEIRLGPGAEPYKQVWANREEAVVRIVHEPRTWTGKVRRFLQRTLTG